MKPIIVDMNDMSDSTEMYDSKPNSVMVGFVYMVLAMVVVALTWTYLFKVDIVVKGTGTIASSEAVATVTNQVAGNIVSRNIEDGQKVNAGDILYIVSHDEQDLQLDNLVQQLGESEERETMLKAYEAWLENGDEFSDELIDNIYFSEISSRKQLVELGQESTRQAYVGELTTYSAKMDANAEMITYYADSVNKSNQLITSIRNRSNSFSSEETYYWNMVENYLVQYQQIINQYNVQTNELQKKSDASAKMISELETEKKVLQEQLTLLQEQVVQEQVIEINDVETVSGGDLPIDSPEEDVMPDENLLLQQELQQKIQNIEMELSAQKAIKENADNSISQYNAEMNIALNAYEKESIAAIEGNILSYEQNKTTYESAQEEYISEQNTLKEQGIEVELENMLTQEKHSVAEELESCRQTQAQLLTQIETKEQNIADAVVRASVDGTINFSTELVEGDYIGMGVQALSIIPDTEEGSYIVRSYVENKDIAKIHEGMDVTYEIAAYPSREYGTMKGKVTFVSADLKVNNNGSAYYMVETSINEDELFNNLGEKTELKVGMMCETKIVIEEKRVLEILIDKIFHISD